MIRTIVVGATGYAGSELTRLLIGHPEVEIVALTSRSEAGKPLASLLPQFSGAPLPDLTTFDPKSVRADLVFLATENGYAMTVAQDILSQGARIVDLSADFRLQTANDYKDWYGLDHAAPDLLEEAAYGLPELADRSTLSKARIIANPGCYPTASALALAPMVRAGLAKPQTLLIDAKSGVSGAGRARIEVDYLFTELTESFKAYGVQKHRHTVEIEQSLGVEALRFTPHLVPMKRGILATCYARPSKSATADELHALYKEAYANEPFVQVRPLGQFPTTREVAHTNRCDIGVWADERAEWLIAISATDNLIKGAAGQAVQNMNLMFGLPETTGLPIVAPV